MPGVTLEKEDKKSQKKLSTTDIREPFGVRDNAGKLVDETTGSLTGVKGKTKWQKFKKALSRKVTGKKTKRETEVMSVNIVQEDETDYEKQWSRRVDRRPGRGDVTNGDGGGSSSLKDEELPDDGIPVIHDEDDDGEL